jgi:hypothetical protein
MFHRNASFLEIAHVIPGQVQRTGAGIWRQLRKGFFERENRRHSRRRIPDGYWFSIQEIGNVHLGASNFRWRDR